MLESKEIALQLLQSNHVSLLNNDSTLVILQIFGNTPVINDLLIRVDKGMEIVSWISFKIFVEMQFDRKLLLSFKVFANSDVFFGIAGEI